MSNQPPRHSHDVDLALDKLLGFKRISAFGNDHADLARAMNATFNKAGGETTGPMQVGSKPGVGDIA